MLQTSPAPAAAAAAPSTGAWASIFRAASDAVFDLPPLEGNLPLLRLSAVLLRLSGLIYDVDDSHVGSQIGMELPIAGRPDDRACVLAKLIHFRGAVNSDGLSSAEQWGVWEVEGVGLCIAFRGTASMEDVLIDVNISPMPLETSQGVGTLEVHQGFYQGARRQLKEIQSVVASHAKPGSKRLPVWITGHSLGGGYANAVVLHMLGNRSCAQLFAAGGGSVTFGAPMVVYSQQAAQLYDRLQKMEAHAEEDAGAQHPPLQFHNFVNGSDIVPRLLGTGMEQGTGSSPILQFFTTSVNQISQHYHPFGTYHFILGSEVRTPAASATEASCSGGGRIGDAAYAEVIAAQLGSMVKTYLYGAASGPVADHRIAAYESGLKGHMNKLAAAEGTRESDADPAALFVLPMTHGAVQEDPSQSFGRSVGMASWSIATAAAGFAGRAALTRLDSGAAAGGIARTVSAAAGGGGAAAGSGSTWGSYFSTAGAAALRAAAKAAAATDKERR